jgi:FkbM family methyltransferase
MGCRLLDGMGVGTAVDGRRDIRDTTGAALMSQAIRQVDGHDPLPALGRETRFKLDGEGLQSVCFYLEQDGIVYPRPLPVEVDGAVRIFPESPGRYVLHAMWRLASGAAGRDRLAFSVAPQIGAHEPRAVKVEDRAALWVPTRWDAETIAAHERAALRALRKIIRHGATVYDIGANLGLFSVPLSRWVGDSGWLYAIEPNPICVYFLRANLENSAARNFTIFPVALSDSTGECRFTLNYGSSMVGASAESLAMRKPGQHIQVDADSLDHLLTAWDLRPPDFIKLDIEGAEGTAIQGMMRTISTYKPMLMLELHGRKPAGMVLDALRDVNYRFEFPESTGALRSADELLASLPEACVQVIGRVAK